MSEIGDPKGMSAHQRRVAKQKLKDRVRHTQVALDGLLALIKAGKEPALRWRTEGMEYVVPLEPNEFESIGLDVLERLQADRTKAERELRNFEEAMRGSEREDGDDTDTPGDEDGPDDDAPVLAE